MRTDADTPDEVVVVNEPVLVGPRENDDVSSDHHSSEGDSDRPAGKAPPPVGLFAGCTAVASALSFGAGILTAGDTTAGLPFVALAVIIAVVPGITLAYLAKCWIAALSSHHQEWVQRAVETSCGRLGALFNASLERSEALEHRLAGARSNVFSELQAAVASKEESFNKKAQADLEKLRVFFESLLEKHVHRIHGELRDKEAQLEQLVEERTRAEAEDERKSKELTEGLQARIGDLEDEFEAVAKAAENSAAELDESIGVASNLEQYVHGLESQLATLQGNELLGEQGKRALECFDNIVQQLCHRLQIARGLAGDLDVGVDDETVDIQRLAGIQRPLEKLAHLVSQVVDLEKLERSEWQAVYSDVSVPDVVRRATGTFRDKARDKGVKIQVQVPKHMGPVVTDFSLLTRALTEIVGNAVAYTDQGGLVSVTVHNLTTDGRGAAEIRVRDSGCGISSKDRKRIFEPFEHGGTPRLSIVGTGAGLGLTLSKAYVDRIGGTLELDTETGRGSTFTILLPEVGQK